VRAFLRKRDPRNRAGTSWATIRYPRRGFDFLTLESVSSAWLRSKRQIKKKSGFMLRSIKQLYGHKLGASDGEIGHIKDFYFDDQKWAIRYVVADTGTWLPGRRVLISPHSLASLGASGKVARIDLTRQQIENSPPIESRKPMSRQYEEEYYRYYGWPYYWQGNALWGMSAFPILKPSPEPLADVPAMNGPRPEREIHLRSMQAVNGYLLRMGDETVGHICDFMIDTRSWAIGQLVVKIGHRLSGKEILIPTKRIDRISYDESMVFAHPTGGAVEQSHAQDVP